MKRRQFVRQLASATFGLATVGELVVVSGCGGGNDTTPGGPPATILPPGSASLTVTTSPNGPAPASMTVVAGAQAVVHPSATGTAIVPLPTGATTMLFVTEGSAATPLLFAIIPSTSSVGRQAPSLSVTPRSTVYGLILLALGAWMLPQSDHARFLQLLDSVPDVQAAVDSFAAAYQANGRILGELAGRADLVASIQRAANAAAIAFASSPLSSDLAQVFGIRQERSITRQMSASPDQAAGIRLTIDGGTVSATNEKAIYRIAQTSGGTSLADWTLLPPSDLFTESTPAVLRPDPPSDGHPITVTVTGGLANLDGAMDVPHAIALGLTVVLLVVIPIISAILGVQALGSFNPAEVIGLYEGRPTTHPLLRRLLRDLVLDPEHIVTLPRLPVISLLLRLADEIRNGQGIQWAEIPSWFFDEVLPAIAGDLPGLQTALIAEIPGLSVSALVSVLELLTAPWLLAIMKGVIITETILQVAPTTMDMLSTDWNTSFLLSTRGGLTVTSAGNLVGSIE